MKRNLVLYLTNFVVLLASVGTASGQNCYIVEEWSPIMKEIEISSGEQISSFNFNLDSGGSIYGFFGIARNPVDNEIYALIDEGNGSRSFCMLDLENELAIIIGDVYYIFDTMEFDSEGNCYAMTSTSDDTPSRLMSVNILTGAVSTLANLNMPEEGFAQALVYDETADVMYRCTGGGGEPFGNEFYFWQEIDLDTYFVSNQFQLETGFSNDYPWSMAMCYQSENSFLIADLSTLYDINSSGEFENPRFMNDLDGVSGIVLAQTFNSIEEETTGLEVVPNPSKGILKLISPNPISVRIDVFDTRGQKVYSFNGNQEYSQMLDLSSLISGVYILSASVDSQRINKKIIINK